MDILLNSQQDVYYTLIDISIPQHPSHLTMDIIVFACSQVDVCLTLLTSRARIITFKAQSLSVILIGNGVQKYILASFNLERHLTLIYLITIELFNIGLNSLITLMIIYANFGVVTFSQLPLPLQELESKRENWTEQ